MSEIQKKKEKGSNSLNFCLWAKKLKDSDQPEHAGGDCSMTKINK